MKTRDNSFEQCMKCTICNDYCPVVKATDLYPGPKQAGPDGERYRLKSPDFFNEALKYCTNCKRCEVACPSDVRIADYVLRAKLQHPSKSHVLRNAALSHTDLVGTLGTGFAPFANIFAGIMFKRGPHYTYNRFERWYRHNAARTQSEFKEKVSYFHGCYVNYNYPELGKDLIKILNALGVGVDLLDKEKCCGIALISNGFVKQAEKQAALNLSEIGKAVGKGRKVITTGSTCTMTIRDEYREILGLDNSAIHDSVEMAVKFIYDYMQSHEAELKFKSGYKKKVAYHTACHMAKLGWSIYSIELLKMIPGVELTVLDQQCCGVAGTYGFKGENKQLSHSIGNTLFENLKQISPDIVATDCETCKWQIAMNTRLNVQNPISILADALTAENK